MPEQEWVTVATHPLWPERCLAVDPQCSLEVGLQRREDVIIHPGKITIIMYFLYRHLCLFNSVFGEGGEAVGVCA